MKDPVGEKTLEIMNTATYYNKWTMEKIAPFISGDILEIGAGIGNFTREFAKLGKVWAGDFNPGYIKVLKKVLHSNNAGFADIEKAKYFFGKKKFDTLVCMNVLEHIRDDNRALGNMHNCLKKNGKLVLMVPAHQWAYGPIDVNLGHYRRYEVAPLKKQLHKAGFGVVEIRYLSWISIFGWFVSGRILKSSMIPQGQLGLFDKIAPMFLWIEDVVNMPFGQSVLAIAQSK